MNSEHTDAAPTPFDVLSYPTVAAATEAFFGPTGPLVSRGFARRESQVTLALTVARQIDGAKGWSLAEAPCGTGKSLAYLVPGLIAVLRARHEDPKSKACVFVSTANIALQGQLVAKDVPWIGTLLGVPLQGVVLKGRNNYLCQAELVNPEHDRDSNVMLLREWAETPDCTGDREDVPFFTGSVWHKVSVQADECTGQACAKHATCFAERARGGLAGAHVVVVNHTMLSLMPKPNPASPYAPLLLAVDEAHELEDNLRKSRSYALTLGAVKSLTNRLHGIKALPPGLATNVQNVLERIMGALYDFARAKRVEHSTALYPGWWTPYTNPQDLSVFGKAGSTLKGIVERESDPESKAKLKKTHESLNSIHRRASILMAGEVPDALRALLGGDWAVWVEYNRDTDRVSGKLSPADIASYVDGLQDSYPTAVLCSATLTTASTFDYTRASLSMAPRGQDTVYRGSNGQTSPVFTPGARLEYTQGPIEELVLPSPFDLPNMGLLVIPRDAPDPKAQDWQAWAVQQVVNAVQQARGRTLVLASSTRAMRLYADALESGEHEVRTQEGTGRTQAVEWFKANTSGVLVGTRSLFQGVDVSGDSCSCVVIDRVPFDPPGDPLETRVAALMAARLGVSEFVARSLPKACRVLAQAGGRLIRSESDRGVLVCLDPRIVGGWMGKHLTSSLPPFPLSRNPDDVGHFLDGRPLQGLMAAPKPTAPVAFKPRPRPAK